MGLKGDMLTTLPRGPVGYCVLAVLLLVISLAYLRPFPISHHYRPDIALETPLPRDAAANATLGFQKILALSTAPSWRTRGLQAAAAYTGLEIEIPDHPEVSTELVEAFSKIGDRHPPLGAAQAWLSHLDMLKYVVQSGLDTVLIVEDDLDWDVTLKDQIRLVSDAVRKFTGIGASDPAPYGREWDILWIGHCGEHTDPDTERVEYPDPTVLKHANYTGWSIKYMGNIAEGHRSVQHGINPVCTFAYAVTRHGAQNVLNWAGSGQNEAYDIRLMEACRPRLLNVVSVQPELMHHYTPPHEAGYWSQVDAGDGKGTTSDEADFENEMGGTENILNSTRCKVLFDSTCVKPVREQF